MSGHDCTVAHLGTPWPSAVGSCLVTNLPGNGMLALLPLFPLAGTGRGLANRLMADALARRIEPDDRSDLLMVAGDAGTGLWTRSSLRWRVRWSLTPERSETDDSVTRR